MWVSMYKSRMKHLEARLVVKYVNPRFVHCLSAKDLLICCITCSAMILISLSSMVVTLYPRSFSKAVSDILIPSMNSVTKILLLQPSRQTSGTQAKFKLCRSILHFSELSASHLKSIRSSHRRIYNFLDFCLTDGRPRKAQFFPSGDYLLFSFNYSSILLLITL